MKIQKQNYQNLDIFFMQNQSFINGEMKNHLISHMKLMLPHKLFPFNDVEP